MHRHIILLIGIALFGLFSAACNVDSGIELTSASLVVKNGAVIDGTGAPPIPDGVVAIDGERIVAVGQLADYIFPDEVMVIDAGGGTILPGVFNAHVHLADAAMTRRELFLLDGVTSVCDMAAWLIDMPDFEQEDTYLGPAARGFKSGPIITAPGGHPGPDHGYFLSYEVIGVEEAKAAVDDLYSRGADYIKVALEPGFMQERLPVLGLDELQSIVAAAHTHGLLVRVHVTSSDMLEIALLSDIDVIEHVPMPSFSPADLETYFGTPDAPQLPYEYVEQLHRMIDQDIVMVPTLDVFFGDVYYQQDLDSEIRAVIQGLLGVVRLFHESGGQIALGNDYGSPGVLQGMPLREMELLLAAGLTPMEVIEAATRHSAYVCGQGEVLGTLEPGKLADLIVLDGNPLQDIAVMDQVIFVVKSGEIVFPIIESSK